MKKQVFTINSYSKLKKAIGISEKKYSNKKPIDLIYQPASLY